MSRKLIENLNRDIKKLHLEVAEIKGVVNKIIRAKKEKRGIWRQLAKHVTALVGLREIILSQKIFLKLIWATLLLVGISATMFDMYQTGIEYFSYPTATSVQLTTQKIYPYPPITVCPDAWLDAERATKTGLTLDALAYSLAYYDEFDTYFPIYNDSCNGKQEFLDFYYANNFSSLLDYYKSIATKLTVHDSRESFSNSSESSFVCDGCQQDNTTISYVNYGFCYTIYLKPHIRDTLPSANYRFFAMSFQNRTKNLMAISPTWILNVCPQEHLHFLNPQCHSVAISSQFKSTIHVSVSKLTSLNTQAAPCNSSSNYHSLDECLAECENEFFQKRLSCQNFWLTTVTAVERQKNLSEFCNYLNIMPDGERFYEKWFQLDDALKQNSENMQMDPNCTKKCIYPCDRTIYQVSLHGLYSMQNIDIMNFGARSIPPDLSVVAVEVKHSAGLDGGIQIWKEIYTYSLSQCISNLGGTLGLFVGGTLLTLAQIILFFINYFLDQRSRNDSDHVWNESMVQIIAYKSVTK